MTQKGSALNRYLVQTNCRLGEDAELHVFDDIGLTGFLARNIRESYETGDGYQIMYIGRYLGNGKLRRMGLEFATEEVTAGGRSDWTYQLVPSNGRNYDAETITFTVRVSGHDGCADDFGVICPSCQDAAHIIEILDHTFECGDCGAMWSA